MQGYEIHRQRPREGTEKGGISMNTWEDTVMKLKAVPEKIFKYGKETVAIKAAYVAGWEDGIQAQAKITWKARDSEVAEARKAGIKEVVKSLSLKPIQLGHDIFLMAEIKKETWQAQLKEWGIKE